MRRHMGKNYFCSPDRVVINNHTYARSLIFWECWNIYHEDLQSIQNKILTNQFLFVNFIFSWQVKISITHFVYGINLLPHYCITKMKTLVKLKWHINHIHEDYPHAIKSICDPHGAKISKWDPVLPVKNHKDAGWIAS